MGKRREKIATRRCNDPKSVAKQAWKRLTCQIAESLSHLKRREEEVKMKRIQMQRSRARA